MARITTMQVANKVKNSLKVIPDCSLIVMPPKQAPPGQMAILLRICQALGALRAIWRLIPWFLHFCLWVQGRETRNEKIYARGATK
ncbi:hypothetical protein NJI34_20475 [Pseudomonas sp. S 311-6]|nr:hypothetical protein [Pseudomonas sp. S 311-6]